MSTFQVWLTAQENRGQNDPVGWLARCWKQFEGQRPKLSSPTSIKKYLAEHGSQEPDWQGYLDQAAQAATAAYHEARNAEPKGDWHDPAARAAAGGTLSAEPQVSEPGPGVNEAIELSRSLQANIDSRAAAGGITWAVEPAERLGKCLQCGSLMGVMLDTNEIKRLACANGHVLGKNIRVGPPLGRSIHEASDPSVATESDESLSGANSAGEVWAPSGSYSEGQWAMNQLQELGMRLSAVETMQGLIVQMLAAASPAAAGVLMEHVQGENPAADGSGPPETLLSQLLSEHLSPAADAVQAEHQPDAYSNYRPQPPAVPQSFEAWMGLAGEGDG